MASCSLDRVVKVEMPPMLSKGTALHSGQRRTLQAHLKVDTRQRSGPARPVTRWGVGGDVANGGEGGLQTAVSKCNDFSFFKHKYFTTSH